MLFRSTPYVYRHKNLGCLVVDYTIDLNGPGWKNAFAIGSPMLIRPFRRTAVKNTLLCHFSRSISFRDGDGSNVIEIEVFNCSLQSTCTAFCECFSGLPVLSKDAVNAPTTGAIGDKKSLMLKPQQRGKFVFPWTPPGKPDGDFVTAKVTGGGVPPWGDIGWNVYPETQFQYLKIL